MLGSLNSSNKRVTVIGGGFAGLLAAYQLDRQGYEVSLYEAQPRPGGLIRTEKTEWGMAEWAAHSLLATEPVEKLCQELGINLVECSESTKYILRNGKFRRFPLNFQETLFALKRALFLKESGVSGRESLTMGSWAERYLGQPACRYFIQPMIQGVYGTSAFEISQTAAFPGFEVAAGSTLWSSLKKYKKEKKACSGIRPKMKTPQNGMEELVLALDRALRKRLKGRYQFNHRLESIPKDTNVVVATSAHAAATLLQAEDSKLADALKAIRYTPLVSVTAFIKKSILNRIPKGVGVLIPEGEKNQALGILFHSSSFEGRVRNPQEWISCALIMGGYREPELLNQTQNEIRGRVIQELDLLFGFKSDPTPDTFQCRIAQIKEAIPVYDDALVRAWELAKQGWCSQTGRILVGNYTGQVSIRGMIEQQTVFRSEVLK